MGWQVATGLAATILVGVVLLVLIHGLAAESPRRRIWSIVGLVALVAILLVGCAEFIDWDCKYNRYSHPCAGVEKQVR